MQVREISYWPQWRQTVQARENPIVPSGGLRCKSVDILIALVEAFGEIPIISYSPLKAHGASPWISINFRKALKSERINSKEMNMYPVLSFRSQILSVGVFSRNCC